MKEQCIPKTLQECILYFSDPDVCVEFVAGMRWLDGIVCPWCGGRSHSYLKTRRIWKCKDCKKQFSVKAGTIFEDSPVPLDKWLMAVWMVVNCKNGVSSYELHRDLKVTQKTAWFMLGRIRLALKNSSFAKLGGCDGGPVEIDETYVGGNSLKMHKSRRLKLTKKRNEVANWKVEQRYPGKTAVQGMLDRKQGKVMATVVPNVKRATLQAEIMKHVHHGSTIYSDQATSYHNLKETFVHETVNHLDEYVRGQVHTNGMENFWSLLKRGLHGTYICVEPFHLFRYVDEQVFRYNNRATKDNPLDDSDRFMLALSQVAGKRLTYAELTGKVGETAF